MTHAKGKDYHKLVVQVLEPLGTINKFVKTGDRVVIKPNMAWDRNPAQAANTHPQLVQPCLLFLTPGPWLKDQTLF